MRSIATVLEFLEVAVITQKKCKVKQQTKGDCLFEPKRFRVNQGNRKIPHCKCLFFLYILAGAEIRERNKARRGILVI